MENPLVSIIIATYNSEKYIKECLESIFNQTYKNLEIIIVDDNSTDDTMNIVLKYENIKIIQLELNYGYPAKPKNIGASFAKGDYLVFFDHDDVMLSDRINNQLLCMVSDDIYISFCDYSNFTNDRNIINSHFFECNDIINGKNDEFFYIDGYTARKILAVKNFIIGGSAMIKNDFFRFNSFNEDLKVSDDYELYYRACFCKKIGIVNSVGFLRRIHDYNITNNKFKTIIEAIICRKYCYDREESVEIKNLIKNEIYNYSMYIYYYIDNFNQLKFYFDKMYHVKKIIGYDKFLIAIFYAFSRLIKFKMKLAFTIN